MSAKPRRLKPGERRVRIYFREEVSYSVDLIVPAGVGADQFHEGSDPDDTHGWFQLLEQQHPKWVNGKGLESLSVDERHISAEETEVLEGAPFEEQP